MAASLGLLGHESFAAASFPPPASSYCFPPVAPELVADRGAVTTEFPLAAAMDDYFLPGFMGARAPDYYDAPPPASVFANGAAAASENEMVNMSYVDDDGRRMLMNHGSGGINGGGRPSPRIGFRTRSEVDVLDDGFKWRKYGKKAVKSSPNPRNYYRCSAEGCGVKKRVERDRDDPRYVVTTYDGVHNHTAPGSGSGGACLAPPRGAQTHGNGMLPRPACSAEGCGVKKRVERDRDDPRYVVTTYDGVHNHTAPGSGSGGACLAPPRGAQTHGNGMLPRPACSAPLVAAPWSAPGGAPTSSDAWGMHAQLMHPATAAHSSESSY